MMRGLRQAETGRIYGIRRRSVGFTLVELIVVLAIIAILAAVGVGSAIGYINRSRFDENNQSAITVYQTAQTALSQKTNNGTIGEWVKETFGTSYFSALDENAAPDSSVHDYVYLTYNPRVGAADGTNDKMLYDLLSDYFYDKAVFNGTITVVFDISATKTTNGFEYNAYVYAAFYSKQNNAASGWDPSYLGHTDENCPDRRSGGIWDELPCTDISCRSKKTYVGFFDGTEASVSSSIVGNVFLPLIPSEQIVDPVAPIVGPKVDPDDPGAVEGFLFNLRNGETLDVSWALFPDKVPSDTPLTITLIDNDDPTIRYELAITTAVTNVTYSSPTIMYEYVRKGDISFNIRKSVQEGLTTVSVTTINGSSRSTRNIVFPITRTDVQGDTRVGCPDDGHYTLYSLSLDCMMNRGEYEAAGNNLQNLYCSSRLFGQNARNICATIKSTGSNSSVVETYASRAIDDPVFFTGVQPRNMPTYTSTLQQGSVTAACYNTRAGVAALDDEDTHKCVVNTLFGDIVSSNGTVTSNGSFSGTTGTAVITSFRHLSNIRMAAMSSTTDPQTFIIARDLDWYIEGSDITPYSEVRVYTRNLSGFRYHSPVENSTVKVVSFPALRSLAANQTLTAAPKTRNTTSTFAINNVTLRGASFAKTTSLAFTTNDTGFGLICVNYGTIYNITANDLSVVLVNCTGEATAAGAGDDRNSIYHPNDTVTFAFNGNPLASYPVGSLVGVNSGNIGLAGNPDNSNTITVNNCVVMSGNYWTVSNNYKNQASGGVIGRNNASVCGVISLNGNFAVVGRDNVGGIIGHSTTDVGARLVVTGSESTVFPGETHIGGARMGCYLLAKNNVGGAIGYLQSGALTYEVAHQFSGNNVTTDPVTGQLTFNIPGITDSDYQLDVSLPAASYIFQLEGYNTNITGVEQPAAGAAIGHVNGGGGEYASIRVRNNGRIIINSYGNNIFCGGVIGKEYNSTTGTVYIDVINAQTSRIGYLDDQHGPLSSGGAYGIIQGSSDNRTIAINAVNNGTIIGRAGADGYGVGGAIGGTGVTANTTYYINVVNNAGSQIISTTSGDANANDGVGGAIGGMSKTSGSLASGSVVYAYNAGSIKGRYRVGGTIGNSAANYGSIYSENVGATITTGQNNSIVDFVGGCVGYMAPVNYGSVQTILRNGTTITGRNFVGGAAGALQRFNDNASVTAIVSDGTNTVSGTGSLIGGVAGDINVVNASGYSRTVSLRGGSDNARLNVTGGSNSDCVGGAVGNLRSNSCDLYAAISAPTQNAGDKLVLSVTGRRHIGGAAGQIATSSVSVTTDASAPVKENLQNYNINVGISIALSPESVISGTEYNVGGAAGKICSNGGTTFGGTVTVTTAAGNGGSDPSIRGLYNVGGAVGDFKNNCPSGACEIRVDLTARACSVYASGASGSGEANVGGAIGGLEGSAAGVVSSASVSAYLGSSNITAESGNNVGGAIGKNALTNSNNVVYNGNVSVTYNGIISGLNNVGGAIGYSKGVYGTTSIISAVITGTNGRCIGNTCVGGAVGLTENYMCGSISATLTHDGAVQGNKYLGGTVGRININNTSATFGNVTAVINTSAPILQSGNVSNTEEACIGGVIGQVWNGYVSNVVLKGTGGTVNLGSGSGVTIPNYPNHNYSNAMLISGSGRSLGGLVGQIGDSAANKNARVYGMSVEADSIHICVVSRNSSSRIGGWVGSNFGQIGQDGNTRFNVNTVSVVYSFAEQVGGFCGVCGKNGTKESLVYGAVTMNLTGATVSGRARVGGAIGDADGVKFYGDIRLSLDSGTRIGDYAGNLDTDDLSGCFCVDVGGAIGRFTSASTMGSLNNVQARIRVEINDEASMIFAGGSDVSGLEDALEISEYGAGGAFGRYGTSGQTTAPQFYSENTMEAYVAVYSPSTYVSVYSAEGNVGGAIGHMLSGKIGSWYSTAVIRGDGNDGCVGGLIGRMDAGDLRNSYTGGHTIGGQYVSGFENVTGVNNVGGLIGLVGQRVTYIKQCYSTASVRGTEYVGGLFGRVDSTTNNFIIGSYATGLISGYDVTRPGECQNFGSFAGYIPSVNIIDNRGNSNFKNKNKVVRAINGDLLRVGNMATQITDNIIYPALWIGCSDYNIRVNSASNYTAYPFDNTLGDTVNGTKDFPLRTFISYTIGSTWYGTHYGDWPSIWSDNVILRNNVSVAGTTYPYSNTGHPIPAGDITVTWQNQNAPLISGTDYTVAFLNSERVGTGTLVVSGIGNYYGSVSIAFTITPADLATEQTEGRLVVTVPDAAYTGSAVEPVPAVTCNGIALSPDTDYDVTYYGQTSGTGYLTITGKGNYTGYVNASFNIVMPSLDDATVTGADTSYTYTGGAITPIGLNYNGTELRENTDYVITYSDNTGVGTATATIEPASGSTYTGGPVTCEFTIVPAQITADMVTVIVPDGGLIYNGGEPVTPDVTVSIDGSTILTASDYSVEYADNTDAGTNTAQVIITGSGINCENTSVSVPFTIEPMTLPDGCITLADTEVTFTGEARMPLPTVTIGETVLTPGTDYDVSYSDNVQIGTATLTVTGKGNYTGTAVTTFEIVPEYVTVTFMVDANQYGDVRQISYGSAVEAPENPSTSVYGRTFAYWYLEGEDPDQSYDFASPVRRDIVLLARWEDTQQAQPDQDPDPDPDPNDNPATDPNDDQNNDPEPDPAPGGDPPGGDP